MGKEAILERGEEGCCSFKQMAQDNLTEPNLKEKSEQVTETRAGRTFQAGTPAHTGGRVTSGPVKPQRALEDFRLYSR